MPADFSHLDPETQAYLNQRYGITKSNKSWRWIAGLLLILGIPWLLWSAWHHSNPVIQSSLVSFSPIDEKSIEITFDITRRNPEQSVLCTLVARDIDKNVVGESDLSIAPSSERIIRESATIPTRLRAVNAAVLRCIAQ
jgi:hypothetical protein